MKAYFAAHKRVFSDTLSVESLMVFSNTPGFTSLIFEGSPNAS